jgi:hypothetical protein
MIMPSEYDSEAMESKQTETTRHNVDDFAGLIKAAGTSAPLPPFKGCRTEREDSEKRDSAIVFRNYCANW